MSSCLLSCQAATAQDQPNCMQLPISLFHILPPSLIIAGMEASMMTCRSMFVQMQTNQSKKHSAERLTID